jgi:hypothetical protein
MTAVPWFDIPKSRPHTTTPSYQTGQHGSTDDYLDWRDSNDDVATLRDGRLPHKSFASNMFAIGNVIKE